MSGPRRRSALQRASGVDDVRDLARRRLPRAVLDFVEGGAEDEVTIARNRQALQDLTFVPRALTDVSSRSQGTTLLGTAVSSPVVLAPVGLAALAHPDGELAAARAASSMGVISTLSSSSAWGLEDVARSCDGPQWFQLYVWRDRDLTRRIVERARAAGFRALCLTVDVPVSARRQRDIRNGFTVPPRPRLRQAGDLVRHAGWFRRLAVSELAGHKLTMGNFTAVDLGIRDRLRMLDVVNELFDPGVGWADLNWLKDVWGGPLVVKGVMTGADARRSVNAGADAVWVSNHGGRQLDGLRGSAEALPEVVAEVGGQAEVYLDGGIRRGSDVVKALALGARACMIGRPWMYGLAAGGRAGVEVVLRLFRTEIDVTLALLGRPTLESLDRGAVSARGT
ncbi:MAG: alpha-hydroxy-acid oxidizing protein [Actinomycetota bacterium]|nr:alpha-hydroxy-acid oxidizing protein [Actinomycetota bacterium]